MMKLSTREIVLTWITLTVLLFGATFVMCGPQIDAFRTERDKREGLQAELVEAQHLAGQLPEYEQRLSDMAATCPGHPVQEDVRGGLLRRLQRISDNHGLVYRRQNVDKEEQLGDLHELTIKWDWESELRPLINVLYDLQEKNVMVDVRELVVRPKTGAMLQGRFTVTYAFSRTNATGRVSTPVPTTNPEGPDQ